LHLFKHGIKPMWEDSSNRRGGSWQVKGVHDRQLNDVWHNIMFSLVGETLDDPSDEQVCGVCCNRRRANRVEV
jgi:translation initiation factor 4E